MMTALEVRDNTGAIEEIIASAADISIEHVRDGDEGWLVIITTHDGDIYLFWTRRLDLLLKTREVK